jgi:hypothetical protein
MAPSSEISLSPVIVAQTGRVALTSQGAVQSPSESPAILKLRIARDGVEIGQFGLLDVRRMIESGELRWEDKYFDFGAGAWLALVCHKTLAG